MKLFKKIIKSLYKKHFKNEIEEEKIRMEENFLSCLDYSLTSKASVKYSKELNHEVPEKIIFEKVESPQVSIIIPVYNQIDFTLKCLQSILNNAGKVSYEIILIDDCSSDETINIANIVENIHIIRNENNLGFLKNCNKAAAVAKGEYIYLLNNDTQIRPKAIEELVKTFEKDGSIAAVGSKLIRESGKLQEAGSLIKKDGWTYAIGNFDNPLLPQYNVEKEVDYCSGASLMVQRAVWNKLEGFDEQFSPGYFEESDLCLRIKKMGLKVFYQPKSEVIHFIGKTFSEKSEKLIIANHKKFCLKWKI